MLDIVLLLYFRSPQKRLNMHMRLPSLLKLFAVITIGVVPNISAQEPDKFEQLGEKVEAISIWVSAFNARNGLALDLAKDHFKIYEDGVEQSIAGFRKGPTQANIGILFDISPSMKEDSNRIGNTIFTFMESGKPIEEYFMLMFDRNITLVPPNNQRDSTLQQARLKHGKGTALYDAIYAGFDQIKNRKGDIAALIIISDGEDNGSKHTLSEIYKMAQHSGVQIYQIGVQRRLDFAALGIKDLVSITGGRAYFPPTSKELDYYLNLIRNNLHSQYLLTYTPSNLRHDGKWRKINVEVPVPKKSPKPILSFKQGYYAKMN
jgi:Ca-activated chloride channel family protein